MGYPYHFVKLSDEQTARRRELLDAYGQFAQLSVLLIPLFFQLSHGIRLIWGRLHRPQNPSKVKEHRSPIVSSRRVLNSPVPTSRLDWSKMRWALGGEVAAGWGTWNEWIFALVWTAWLLLLAVKDTGDDYLHFTKRLGIVAASQLPVHYLLAAKAWSPIQFIARMSHEELNVYHGSLGRIIVFLMACHASLYLNFFIQTGLLSKRIRNRDVILGLCAIAAIIVLSTTALKRIRDYNYRIFLVLHVTISALVLPTLYFHVSHIRIYILESLAVFILIITQRKLSQRKSSGHVSLVDGTNLLSVSVKSVNSLINKSSFPGLHIFILFPQLKDGSRINPFTLAQAQTKEGEARLIIRPLSGTTSLLRQIAQKPQPVSVQIEGPYGAAHYFPNLTEYDGVLLVAGGVGATFILPIYRHLLSEKEKKGGSQHVKFVWAVKQQIEAEWGIQMLAEDNFASVDGFELYVTEHDVSKSVDTVHDDIDQGIELQERQGLLNRATTTTDDVIPIAKRKSKDGRPRFPRIIDSFFSEVQEPNVAVLVCGPVGLGSALRKEVGRWVSKEANIFWHDEQFGW